MAKNIVQPVTLKLSARITVADEGRALVEVSWDESHTGMLWVDSVVADELVNLLNAATGMREALRRIAEHEPNGFRYRHTEHTIDILQTIARAAMGPI